MGTGSVAHLTAVGFEHVVLWVMQANHAARSFYEGHSWVLDEARDYYHLPGQAIAQVRYSRSAQG